MKKIWKPVLYVVLACAAFVILRAAIITMF